MSAVELVEPALERYRGAGVDERGAYIIKATSPLDEAALEGRVDTADLFEQLTRATGADILTVQALARTAFQHLASAGRRADGGTARRYRTYEDGQVAQVGPVTLVGERAARAVSDAVQVAIEALRVALDEQGSQ